MTYEQAREKLIEKYGKTWFFTCQDCCGWSKNDVIAHALMEEKL